MSEKTFEKISAGGGVVFRSRLKKKEPEVLLIFRNGLWDLPKGKHEPGESIEMCAVREVAEETGSSLPAIVLPLGTTYHEYQEKGIWIGKTTYWYSMIFTKPQDLNPQKVEGIEKLEWFGIHKAVELVGYDNLRKVLHKFMQQKKV